MCVCVCVCGGLGRGQALVLLMTTKVLSSLLIAPRTGLVVCAADGVVGFPASRKGISANGIIVGIFLI